MRRTHGLSGVNRPRVYRVWAAMKTRCNNPNTMVYARYGGRGITYDPRWESFEVFFDDMGHPPTPMSTLERRDNAGNYCKANCTWATYAEQSLNKRNNVRYEYLGQSKTLGEWARETGIQRLTILKRLSLGWPIDLAMTAPVSLHNRIGPRN